MNYNDFNFLVVEDNISTLTMIVNMLANIGAQNVVTARNGREAWERIESPEMRIDIVLSDMLMPEEDGLQLLQRIRNSEEYWYLPFSMITCVDDMDRIMSVTEEHIDAYLVKPVTEVVLRQKIYSVIKKPTIPPPTTAPCFRGENTCEKGTATSLSNSWKRLETCSPDIQPPISVLTRRWKKSARWMRPRRTTNAARTAATISM